MYEAMTINERLVEAGLLDLWDQALRQRDSQKLIDLLKLVELNEVQAKVTVDRHLGKSRELR
jgi:hypothetical protein